MNEHLKPPPPPDLGRFHENWIAFPREERLKYAGKFVAWSPDGLRIVASGDSEQEVEEKLVTMGIDPSQVVGENISPADEALFGTVLDDGASCVSLMPEREVGSEGKGF